MALEKIALEDEYFVNAQALSRMSISIPASSTRRSAFRRRMFTAIFALARTVGWIAQWNEMIGDPDQKIATAAPALYRRRQRTPFVPMDKREVSASDPPSAQHHAYHELRGNSYLFGANAPFHRSAVRVAICEDPQSVEPRWRSYFDELQRLDDGARRRVARCQSRSISLNSPKAARAAARCADDREHRLSRKAIRCAAAHQRVPFSGRAHRRRRSAEAPEKPPVVAELDPAYYGLGDADMETVFGTGSLVGPREMKLREILQLLRDTYCRTIGVEYMYMTDVPRNAGCRSGSRRSRVDSRNYDAEDEEPHPRAAHRGGNAREVSAYALRRARSAFRSRAATA